MVVGVNDTDPGNNSGEVAFTVQRRAPTAEEWSQQRAAGGECTMPEAPTPSPGAGTPAVAAEYVPSGKHHRSSLKSHWTAPGDPTHSSPIWSEAFYCSGAYDNVGPPESHGAPCMWMVNNAERCKSGEALRCLLQLCKECSPDDSDATCRATTAVRCP